MNSDVKKRFPITDFWIGLIIGSGVALIIMSLVLGLVVGHYRNKERVEYAERQTEIEELRKEYSGRTADDFLDMPGVRGAADRGTEDFDRRRDEILQRFRDELDRGSVDGSGSWGD